MICRCFGRDLDLSAASRLAGQTARLMAGVPDYEAYLAHQAHAHPGVAPMTRDAFFRDRQAARYASGGGLRCC